MATGPRVIQIRSRAVAGIVEGVNDTAVAFYIAVLAGEVSERIDGAGEAIHTGVVVLTAGFATGVVSPILVTWCVIRAVWYVGECTEVVVEGMVLLHHDDDVV